MTGFVSPWQLQYQQMPQCEGVTDPIPWSLDESQYYQPSRMPSYYPGVPEITSTSDQLTSWCGINDSSHLNNQSGYYSAHHHTQLTTARHNLFNNVDLGRLGSAQRLLDDILGMPELCGLDDSVFQSLGDVSTHQTPQSPQTTPITHVSLPSTPNPDESLLDARKRGTPFTFPPTPGKETPTRGHPQTVRPPQVQHSCQGTSASSYDDDDAVFHWCQALEDL